VSPSSQYQVFEADLIHPPRFPALHRRANLDRSQEVRKLRLVSFEKKLVWARYCRDRLWNRRHSGSSAHPLDQPEEFDDMNTDCFGYFEQFGAFLQ
jgi:hypothetical protein